MQKKCKSKFSDQMSDETNFANADADDGDDNDLIEVTFPQIARTRTSIVYTREARKIYQPVYRKGRVTSHWQTLPFGYQGRDEPVNDNENMIRMLNEEQVEEEEEHIDPQNDNSLDQIDPNIPGCSTWTARDYLR